MRISTGLHVGLIILVVGAILGVVSIRNVAWAFLDSGSGILIYYGLYLFCVEVNGVETCNDFSDPKDELNASRGLATGGTICILMAVLLIFCYMFFHYKDKTFKTSTIPLIAAIIFACLGAVANTVANAVYGAYADSDLAEADLFYCFYLIILSSILAVVGASVAYAGRPQPIHPNTMTTANGAHIAVIQQHQGYPPYPPTTTTTTNQAYPTQPYTYGQHPPPPPPPTYGQQPAYNAAFAPKPWGPNPNPSAGDPAYPPPVPPFQGQDPSGNPPGASNYQPPPPPYK